MPFDPSQLPDLSSTQDIPDNENFLTQLLKKRKIMGELGPIDYEIGTSKAKLNGQFNNAMAELMLKYNGDWGLDVNTPLLGGSLDFNAQNTDGQRNYGLRYKRDL